MDEICPKCNEKKTKITICEYDCERYEYSCKCNRQEYFKDLQAQGLLGINGIGLEILRKMKFNITERPKCPVCNQEMNESHMIDTKYRCDNHYHPLILDVEGNCYWEGCHTVWNPETKKEFFI